MKVDFSWVVDNISDTIIKESAVHGHGLWTEKQIAQGTTLGVLDGQVIPWALYNHLLAGRTDDSLLETCFMEWNAISKDTLLVRGFRTKYSFINHSRQPNLILRENPLRVETLVDIPEGQELFLDYRKEDLSDEYLQGHGKTYL